MEKTWIFIITLLIFGLFTFLFWAVTHRYVKKEYGMKMWKQWPSRLSYWQAAVFYSLGFTVITVFLLKWTRVWTF